jgi:hypothetical protein
VVQELLAKHHENLNMQVRAFLEGCGIDVDRVLESVEIGLEDEEVRRARELLAEVFGGYTTVMTGEFRDSNYVLSMTSEPEPPPKGHSTPIVDGVVSNDCSVCGAHFFNGAWSKRSCE